MALTRRDVRLTVTHDGKPMLTLPAAAALRDRLAAVHGGAFAGRLLDVDDVSGTTHVSGLVERPADVGTATRRVFLSVNGRAIARSGTRARRRGGVSIDDSRRRSTDAVPRHRRRRGHGRRQRASGQGRSALSRSVAGRARRRNGGAPRPRHLRRGRDVRPPVVGGPTAAPSLSPRPAIAVDVEALSPTLTDEASDGLFEPAAEALPRRRRRRRRSSRRSSRRMFRRSSSSAART